MMYVCLLGVHTLCMCLLGYIHCVYVSTRVHIPCVCVYLGYIYCVMCLLGYIHCVYVSTGGTNTVCMSLLGYIYCVYVSTRVHILCVCVY